MKKKEIIMFMHIEPSPITYPGFNYTRSDVFLPHFSLF
jgi:hypothetical protein